MAGKWERKQKSKDTVIHTRTLILDDTLNGKSVGIVAGIIEKEGMDIAYRVWYEDQYIRGLNNQSDGRLIVMSGTKPPKNLGRVKDMCEAQMQYELYRATDLMDSPIYRLYNNNIEDIVADQLKNDDYKGINVQNGLEGTVMVYGNGQKPHQRHWKITGFPVVFECDPE